jgi:hypothetical protein
MSVANDERANTRHEYAQRCEAERSNNNTQRSVAERTYAGAKRRAQYVRGARAEQTEKANQGQAFHQRGALFSQGQPDGAKLQARPTYMEQSST